MSKPSLVILVVEDDHHRQLMYKYLKNRGLKPHEIRVERSPSGQGSADNWVRKRFVKETNAYRSRHAQTALIVVIDADTRSVEQRLDELSTELRNNGKDHIDPAKERVAQLIPKRNIESWILCLNGQTVDEETDYKNRHDFRTLIPQAAYTLSEWTHSNTNTPEYWIDSLRRGVAELNRLAF